MSYHGNLCSIHIQLINKLNVHIDKTSQGIYMHIQGRTNWIKENEVLVTTIQHQNLVLEFHTKWIRESRKDNSLEQRVFHAPTEEAAKKIDEGRYKGTRRNLHPEH